MLGGGGCRGGRARGLEIYLHIAAGFSPSLPRWRESRDDNAMLVMCGLILMRCRLKVFYGSHVARAAILTPT